MLLRTLKSLFTSQSEAEQTIESRVLRLLSEKNPEEAKTVLLPYLERNSKPEQLALMGEVEYHLKNHSAAERLFLDALTLKPGLAGAHYGLSLHYYDEGRYDDALAQALFSRNCAPGESRILAQLGLCCIALHDYGQARHVLRQAVLLDQDNVPALNNLGIALFATHERKEALYYFQRAYALQPEYGPVRENLRNLFGIENFLSHYNGECNIIQSQIEDNDATTDSYSKEHEVIITNKLEEAFEATPEDEDTAIKLIKHYLRTLQLEAANDVLLIAHAHIADSAALETQSGRIALMLGKHKKAQTKFETALSLSPEYVPALLGLGQALRNMDLHEDAIEPIEKAVTLQENTTTLLQLAFSQVNACQYEQALRTCARVEELKPELAPFMLSSRAVCHSYLGNFDKAISYIEEAQRFEPLNPSFTIFRGMINLQHERYTEGWDGYRLRALGEAKHMRLLPYPLWQGESLDGKTILILAEQGLGDQVMFSSCLSDLLSLGPRQVVLEAHERVEKTLARSFPHIRVFPSGQRNFDWLPKGITPDYYAFLADLPRHFRRNIEDFPIHSGYLLADSARVAFWKSRLDQLNSKIKIGISWQGGLQQTRRTIRSLHLEQMDALLSNRRVQFINLQYGDVQQEIDAYNNFSKNNIVFWPEAIENLDEFAALISALDLVITVCNTTVHYTGGLGRPCWVMAPFIPEWRYGLSTTKMRWYPSVNMFRQECAGDWENVLYAVSKSLEALVNETHPHP